MSYQPSLPAGTYEGRFSETADPVVTNASGVLDQRTDALKRAGSPLEIIAARQHRVLEARFEQLNINILGLRGGKPYVEERLSRFAGESRIDWEGGDRGDGTRVTGRKDQAHCVPHLARISEKINQYVLGIAPDRGDAPEEITNDITADGMSVDAFMREANNYVTACGWCWIGVDAPANPTEEAISIARKAEEKIRPYWSLYAPTQVVDWYFDARGQLKWLLTESIEYLGADPWVKPAEVKIRRLWQPGVVTEYTFGTGENKNKIIRQEEKPLSLTDRVPFVLVGQINSGPHGFDSLESIARTIMDLESVNRQNFFNSVYPQLHLPESALQTLMEKLHVNAEDAVAKLLGLKYPILTNKDDPIPGYIMPDSGGIGTIREELTELKRALYDSVGLMLQQETRQVASAESKAWDFLDIKHVMKERAGVLEDAEKQAVAISQEWDGEFPEWEPVYNRDFDIANFKEEMDGLVLFGNLPGLTPGMKQLAVERAYELVKGQGSGQIRKELQDQIADELENWEEPEPVVPVIQMPGEDGDIAEP